MISIRTMTAADLELGMRLKEQAGWNQTQADWERFLALQPDGCFVAEFQGQAAGTAVACLFHSVAWVAMVLVEERMRGQGIGGALLRHALAFAENRGATSIRLDATPAGRPLYEKLGFQPQYALQRFAGSLQPPADESAPSRPISVRQAMPVDYPRLLELDRRATQLDRRKFLLRWFAERPTSVFKAEADGALRGYLATRAGSAAVQLGPCIADAQAGAQLLAHACQKLAGEQAFIDLPVEREDAAQLVSGAGLAPQRSLLRMCRGAIVDDDHNLLWSSSGPELG
jgi:GNAT superfamily N-acetyltransferase